MNKEGIKIVTIGGGSSYTPELMEGFIKRYPQLPIKEIWLVDIEAGKEKLDIVGAMAQRMWDASGYKVKVHCTLDRKKALKDADFVTTQFRVGQLEARIKDERIPLQYGMLGQETNGAGGILKAFRTIPVILDIVSDMNVLCPNAWLINFTNPSGIITETIIKHGDWKKCIGLCNVPIEAMMKEPHLMHREKEELIFQFAGLNHFHWHKIYDKKGKDLTLDVIHALYEGNDDGTPANIIKEDYIKEQLLEMELVPCYYHRYYYMQQDMVEHGIEEMRTVGTRAEQVKVTEQELFELYKDPALNYKPAQLELRGGAYYSDAACECINAISNDKQIDMVVSTQNRGALSDLASDSIVEVSSTIGATGALPHAWGTMRPAQKGWLQVMKAMEECVIEAAISGDYGKALQAFSLNPLIPSGKEAKQVLNELLVAHEAYLPQFQDTIDALKQEGIASNDPVVCALMREGK